jgi:alanine racemase
MRSAAIVDLDALRDNVAVLRQRVGPAQVMAVVKADGYGHGLLPSAQAAVRGGATWLGVAFLEEALALRAAGLTVPVLSWLSTPSEDPAPALKAGIDLGVYSLEGLARVAAAGSVARIHLKIDTGLSRGGAPASAWADLCEAAAKAEAEGSVVVVGVWSHFAFAEEGPDHPVNQAQSAAFDEALEVANAQGLQPQLRHLANSAALLTAPETHYDLVRAGAAIYGLSAAPAFGTPQDFGLTPVMSLRSEVALTKRVLQGAGVSYRHRYVTPRETTLALVPLGYGDGLPRSASNTAEVLIGGRRRTIAGTVAMDQVVIDVGDDEVVAGDEVLLFGAGDQGEPTTQEWAAALGTIDYEIVTRVGARVPRRYIGGGA